MFEVIKSLKFLYKMNFQISFDAYILKDYIYLSNNNNLSSFTILVIQLKYLIRLPIGSLEFVPDVLQYK